MATRYATVICVLCLRCAACVGVCMRGVVSTCNQDVATRLFLKRLKRELNIPVMGLVDSDPYGLKILSVYMSGETDTHTHRERERERERERARERERERERER